jgi:cyanophycinase
LQPTQSPEVCQQKTPLTFRGISVYKAPTTAHFNLPSWTGAGGVAYSLSVEQGTIHSTQPDGAVY